MNYIKHLNAFFGFIKNDNSLTASHVSLYLALFQYWNFNRFQNPFPIYRSDIMKLCKIGSKNTYHKCVRELHQAKYILYHPASHKYQPVKISMIRLDKQVPNNPDQLDIFSSSPPLKGEDLGGGFSPKTGTHTSTDIGTTHVPNLTETSPNNETNPVSKMGHLIKQSNNKQERETPTHKIFKRNKKIQNDINDFAAGGHFPSPSGEGGRHRRTDEADFGQVTKSVHMPTLEEVIKHFTEINLPAAEAKKFFSHYKAIGWKIQGITPIEDWKALTEKWMENAKKWEMSPSGGGGSQSRGRSDDPTKDIQYLYEQFLEGKKIFKYILPEHLDQLKLQLTEEIVQQARKERIDQFTGTNQNSIIQLWQAYLTGDPNHELVQKDHPNLIALAKRMAVIKHFNNLKNQTS